ncbi:hypothetical protein F7734_46920 [Scytonema sp. UIC 10036]|uniref:carbohydrate porin n=1 Tax=Scytonema sp. UIC 10036 TaxID=2304196 RepID=UPI0012DACBB6|nr:carbohydrate porin [Scytonema sp. UIC 10036]MUG99425.1 hypothetical protein [Scytonema sp. UIC 10036]
MLDLQHITFKLGSDFFASEIGDSTQTNFEVYYNIPINNNIQITPLFQAITDAGNQNDNSTIWTGTLRTVLSFWEDCGSLLLLKAATAFVSNESYLIFELHIGWAMLALSR